MNILIVDNRQPLAKIWRRHLERLGNRVFAAHSFDQADAALNQRSYRIIILDLELDEISPLSVAGLASYRQPEARVIFVTSQSFFTDGVMFAQCSNACAYLPGRTPPDDMAALVEHFGQTAG